MSDIVFDVFGKEVDSLEADYIQFPEFKDYREYNRYKYVLKKDFKNIIPNTPFFVRYNKNDHYGSKTDAYGLIFESMTLGLFCHICNNICFVVDNTKDKEMILNHLRGFLSDYELKVARDKKNKIVSDNSGTWEESVRVIIPDIGTALKLSEDWKFRPFRDLQFIVDLVNNSKNVRYWDEEEYKDFYITLNKDSIFVVDRIYIKSAKKNCSYLALKLRSGSFTYKGNIFKAKKSSIRFCAKLEDINKIKAHFMKETIVR